MLARTAGDRRPDSDSSLHSLQPSGTDPAAPTSLTEALESRGHFTEQMNEWSQRTDRVQREKPKHQMRCLPSCTPSSALSLSLAGHAPRVASVWDSQTVEARGSWLPHRSKREAQHWKDLENNPNPTVWTIDWLLSKLTGDQLAGDKLAVRTRPSARLDVQKARVNTICTLKHPPLKPPLKPGW